MRDRYCGNPFCSRHGDTMISWGSQRVPICKQCKTLLQSGRGLPAEKEIRHFLKVALWLAEDDDDVDFHGEFSVRDFHASVQSCYEVCAKIAFPAGKELTAEEELQHSILESEAMEEYLRGRIA